MGLTQQYISFMTPAASSGDLDITLETFDLLANITLTLGVSGITGSETTKQLGQKVWTQMNTFLVQNEANFPNVPPLAANAAIETFLTFADEAYQGIFSCTWTDHVVCVASQCNFTLTISDNDTGARIDVDSSPILVDIPTADEYVPFWEADDGSEMTDAQKVIALKRASAKLTSHLRNNIVLSTYIDDFIGDGKDSVDLRKSPVRDFYPPRVRYAFYITWGNYKTLFALDKEGIPILKYRWSQPLVLAFEPFDYGNEILVAYIAGYQKIPSIIKEIVTTFATDVDSLEGSYKSMAAEGSKVEFWATSDFLKEWAAYLSEYYCA